MERERNRHCERRDACTAQNCVLMKTKPKVRLATEVRRSRYRFVVSSRLESFCMSPTQQGHYAADMDFYYELLLATALPFSRLDHLPSHFVEFHSKSRLPMRWFDSKHVV